MTRANELEALYDELYHELQIRLPERCQGCGHAARGVRKLAEELVAGVVTKPEALIEIDQAVADTNTHCKLGYVASRYYTDKKVCSFELKPYVLNAAQESNDSFDIRFDV